MRMHRCVENSSGANDRTKYSVDLLIGSWIVVATLRCQSVLEKGSIRAFQVVLTIHRANSVSLTLARRGY